MGTMEETLHQQLEELHEASFMWALSCTSGDRVEAEEVLQTVYLEILEGRARFQQQSALQTWLFGVIRNTARNRARSRTYRKILLLQWNQAPPAPTRADEDLEHSQERQRLREALQILSTRQREVMELVFYHDLTLEESADVLGISVGSARTHYHRGKTQLIKHLATQEEAWATAMNKN